MKFKYWSRGVHDDTWVNDKTHRKLRILSVDDDYQVELMVEDGRWEPIVPYIFDTLTSARDYASTWREEHPLGLRPDHGWSFHEVNVGKTLPDEVIDAFSNSFNGMLVTIERNHAGHYISALYSGEKAKEYVREFDGFFIDEREARRQLALKMEDHPRARW